MAKIDYQIQIYKHDIDWAVPTVPEIQWTFLTDDLSEPGEYGGQTIRPLEGRAEARSWTIQLLDTANQITTKLGDADGVNDMAARMIDISDSIDGGGYTLRATGRIADITLLDVNSYDIEIVDEFARVRGTPLFTTTNTQIFPPSVRLGTAARTRHGGGNKYVDEVFIGIVYITQNNTSLGHNVVKVWFQQDAQSGFRVLTSKKIVDAMKDDVWRPKPTLAYGVTQNPDNGLKGSFLNLRVFLRPKDSSTGTGFTEYEVIRFIDGDQSNSLNWAPHGAMAVPDDWYFNIQRMGVEISDPGNSLTLWDTIEGYVIIENHAPSEDLPFWITLPWPQYMGAGLDTFTWVKDKFDELGVRYETAAFSQYNESTNPNGLIDNPSIPMLNTRIIKTEDSAIDWMTERIFKPCGVVAFQNTSGVVAPRLIRMPSADLITDPDNLFEFTAAKIHDDYPSWLLTDQEMITVCDLTYYTVKTLMRDAIIDENSEIEIKNQSYVGPNDFVSLSTQKETIKDPLADRFGERALDFDLSAFILDGGFTEGQSIHDATLFRNRVAQETFLRVASGTIFVEFTGTLATVDVISGQWVRVNVDELPNLVGGGQRGGTRVMQVLDKWYEPGGYPRFRLWDAGPSLQPLPAPTITAAKNSSDGFHSIDIDISGFTGDSWTLDINASATDPSESDPDWIRVGMYTASSIIVTPVASGTKFYFRARQNAEGRISSDWSTHQGVTMDTLSAPTALTEALVARTSAVLQWATAEPSYAIEVEVTQGGTIVFNDILMANAVYDPVRYDLNNLDPSTFYDWRVRHIDEYGGVGTWASDSFTTAGGAAGTCPDIRGVFVLVGTVQGREVSS